MGDISEIVKNTKDLGMDGYTLEGLCISYSAVDDQRHK